MTAKFHRLVLGVQQAQLNAPKANDIAIFQGCRVTHFNIVDKATICAMQVFNHAGMIPQLKACLLL